MADIFGSQNTNIVSFSKLQVAISLPSPNRHCIGNDVMYDVCKRACCVVSFYVNMADIRLLFNKSYAKKWKSNNDSDASKLLSPKTDTDDQHVAPGLIECESSETLQSAQLGLPPSNDSESECEFATDDCRCYSSEPEEKDHRGECDDLVPVDECSSSESAGEEMKMTMTMCQRHSQSQLQIRAHHH